MIFTVDYKRSPKFSWDIDAFEGGLGAKETYINSSIESFLWGKDLSKIIMNNHEFVDTEKYEIVEKPEYKLKRLKLELENAKSHEDTCSRLINHYGNELRETQDNIENLEKQIKELENESKD